MKAFAKLIAGVAVAAFSWSIALADVLDDGQNVQYYQDMKGKKVVFVPQAAGIDNVEGYITAMRKQAEALGYTIDVRDPNWNTDLGAQAISAAINEKPDVLVVMNQDVQSYARLLKQAMAAGIPVIQVQVKSQTTTDGYAGPEWYDVGYRNIKEAMETCSPKKGKSGKIAIIQGTPTNPANAYGMAALETLTAENPDIKVVSTQAGDWDATKAHGVASTVLKQNPDLCAYIGFWDGQDVGVAAAIKEAGLTGKVLLFSSGGGNQSSCEQVKNGSFDYYVSYDAAGQARDLNDAIKVVLQQKNAPGEKPFVFYSNVKIVTKETLTPTSCWSKKDF
ncbi:sugar ABC transporter substrate-binding protein [Agrobacterium rhizogenes]|nr:sugar ABC transporter substrate-binding protein [Rhizobium rhizogenes]NTG32161.1 sugar ABC transporter substrate-binding protein [Rhizobium rhizogenes]NTG39058.1 sugar ABC transporter substrate-binding protein [Rhizobium rhizogenes]NTG58184.1 sugar ABC transporter substrate-binding protein [Rhizobium rhizogenes]NTI59530.1 sugar ABC transporter substrate-binding protein [Rhizobium rhizogenes]